MVYDWCFKCRMTRSGKGDSNIGDAKAKLFIEHKAECEIIGPARYVQMLSKVSKPLRRLTESEATFAWRKEEKSVFEKSN